MNDEVEFGFKNVPLRILNLSTRTKLALMLDMTMDIPTRKGYLKDWRGLAELAGFKNEAINTLSRFRRPTEELLTRWQNQPNGTIDFMLTCLEELGRFDVIDDLIECFRKDADDYIPPVNQGSTSSEESKTITSGNASINTTFLTKHDIAKSSVQYYDAYVCYSNEDYEFVEKLISFLEGEHNFKLCIKDRDLLGGVLEYQATMELIENRCDKLLVVLSPVFLEDATLEYTTMCTYALSLEKRTRKLVPVIYKKCELPHMIRAMAKLDYNSQTFNFWQRLVDALQKNSESPSTNSANENSSLLPTSAFTEQTSTSISIPAIQVDIDIDSGFTESSNIDREVHSDENDTSFSDTTINLSISDSNLTKQKKAKKLTRGFGFFKKRK